MIRKMPILGIAAALAAAAAGLVPPGSSAIAAPTYVGVEGGNVAVSGYDAVSYFVGDGQPVEGKAEFTVEYDGAIYHFANANNASRFSENPAAYAPQFGGHCAWAMARGHLAPGDPEQYAVVDGKLYLNFDAEVKRTWDANRAEFIVSAHKNWKTIPPDAKFGG